MGTTTSREMTAADIAAVREIDREAFFDPWSDSLWVEELNNAITTYLVLLEQDRVVGFAGYWLVVGEAQITRVAVAKDCRNRGLGLQLTGALVERAWQQEAEAITLEVRSSNVPAQRVYEACGFKACGVRPNYYADNHEDAVIMWLYK